MDSPSTRNLTDSLKATASDGARLVNNSKSFELARNLKVAKTYFARAKGLLGLKEFPQGQGLWIPRCLSIHTCFMRFSIDAIFVDERFVVRAVHHNIVPWRVTLPVWGASSVFELPAGTLARCPTEVGDQLYVGA